LRRRQQPTPTERRPTRHAVPPAGAVRDLGGDLSTPEGLSTAEARLVEGYGLLKQEAAALAIEMKAVMLSDPSQVELDDSTRSLELLSRGHISAVVGHMQPRAVREVARSIREAPDQEESIIAEDFEDVVRWATSKNPPLTPTEIREKLVKRKALLEAILPESRATEARTANAISLVERQFLKRQYVNTETMYGDAVEDIPQDQFFVSEDNYAWDMSELAAALKANSGVMRNPLSRQIFSEVDIHKILNHPSGRELRPMKLAQDKMRRGVRPATVDQVAKLGSVMMADQSQDMMPSRYAIDEFLAFVATLPDEEQKTLQSLRVEARDSLNGQPYDSTVWQAIQDAKGNMTCVHKVRAPRSLWCCGNIHEPA